MTNAEATLVTLLFGLGHSLVLNRRYLGWGETVGARASIFEPGSKGCYSTQDKQDNTESKPRPGHRGHGPHVFGPAEQQT